MPAPRRALRLLPLAVIPFALFLVLARGGAAPTLDDQALSWLRSYLKLDTSNPPGNEHLAARLLRDILHREGVATRLFVSPEGRHSLWARLESGAPEGGALVLMHHMDVVPPGEGWSSDPFAAEERDERLWARGAVDSKSLGIAQLAAFLELHRSGRELARDVIYLAVADEESGGIQGTGWLVDAHPELFESVAAVLNEGGSNRALNGRLVWWGVEIAQKRPLWLRVVAKGRGGHGSTLDLYTAPHRLVRALARLADRPLELRLTPPVRRYLETVAPMQGARFQRMVAELDETLASPQPLRGLLPGIPAYLTDSIQITVLAAGERINVTPRRAEALLDARLLPDTDSGVFLAGIRELLGKEVAVEVLLDAPPSDPSPIDTEIYRCLERVLSPRGPVVPTFVAGVTDSRYFRQRGIPAYGFSPFALDGTDLRGIHGADEKIPVALFADGVETMTRLLSACAAR